MAKNALSSPRAGRDSLEVGIPVTWDRAGLEAVGYEGFVPLLSLSPGAPPTAPGTYVVLRPRATGAVFLERRRGEPHRRWAMAYDLADLQVDWDLTGNRAVLYIGKADQPLRKRLSQFRRSGLGGSGSHEGGRSLWWLDDAGEFLVAWRALAPEQASGAKPAERHEHELLTAFIEAFGTPPWANIDVPAGARAYLASSWSRSAHTSPPS